MSLQLNRVGLKADKERQRDPLRGAQSQEHLLDTRLSVDTPPLTPKTKKEGKQRGGFFGRFKRKKGGKERVKSTEEEGAGVGRDELGGGDEEEGRSFLTTSISMPNIACELAE